MTKKLCGLLLLTQVLWIGSPVAQTGWVPINNGLTNLHVRSIAVDAQNPATLYIGTEGAGVFKSSNSGNSWLSASNGLTGFVMTDLTIDRSDPATLYVGSISGGVHRTLDGGNTWTPLNTGMPALYVGAVILHPQNSSIIYAGPDAYGIYRSVNSGTMWSPVGGGRDVRGFAADAASPSIAYAATVQSVLKTTTDGASWSYSGGGLPSSFVFGLAVEPGNPSVVYCGPHQRGVWKSINSGSSWFAANSGLPAGESVVAIAVDPSNSGKVYAGTSSQGVYLSTDGGVSWQALNDGLTNFSIQQNALAIDPLHPEIVYVGTGGGGIFKLGSAITASFTVFGTACGTPPPGLSASAPPIPTRPFEVDVTNLTVHQAGVLLVGVSGLSWNGMALPIDLGQIGMLGCSLYVSGEVQLPFTSGFSTTYTWSITVPSVSSLLGASFFTQAFLVDPSANPLGLVSTNAGKATIGF